jgi:hypothetical protein
VRAPNVVCQLVGQRSGRASDHVGAVGKGQRCHGYRRLVRGHNGLVGKQTLQGQTIEVVEDHTTGAQVAQRGAHLGPAVERANGKAQLGLLHH